MSEFFSKTFYGNTIREWAISLIVIAAAVIIGKIVYWLLGNVIKKITSKTKTRLDDILIDMLEEPLVFAIIIFGVWISLGLLTFPEIVNTWIERVYHVLIIFNIAWLVSRLIDALIEEYVVPIANKTKGNLDDQLLPIIRKSSKIIIWVMAIIIALDNAGYDVAAVLAGLGIGGLAFAFAAKETIANLFGGITIFADKPFRVNDRIKVDGYDGFVREIGLRSTRIETLEGRMVTIPNANIANNTSENVSSEPSRKVVNNLGLTYDMDDKKIELAMTLLHEIIKNNTNTEEKVLISFNSFGDFALNILFIYYIKPEADILETQTEVNLEVLRKFNENNLDFAFPSQTVYTKSI